MNQWPMIWINPPNLFQNLLIDLSKFIFEFIGTEAIQVARCRGTEEKKNYYKDLLDTFF